MGFYATYQREAAWVRQYGATADVRSKENVARILERALLDDDAEAYPVEASHASRMIRELRTRKEA